MSTTEDHAPAPSVTTQVQYKPGRTHVWTDKDGRTHGVQYLDHYGSSSLYFHDPGQVRDLIGHLATLAGEMDAEITRQRLEAAVDAAENQMGPPCARCGHGGVVTRQDGEFRCYNHERCAERVAARDAEAAQVTR